MPCASGGVTLQEKRAASVRAMTDAREPQEHQERLAQLRHLQAATYQERLAQLRRLQAEFGKLWQGMRERVDRPCTVCGTIMRGVTKTRRYCSVACQSKAWRQRHPEYAERKRARRAARRTPPTE